ncbi:hypothetical protein ACIREO_37190 [Streptomyces sp. NPDC102441]|uniref:hypothetical protein n=1 Tax=Streptomyces sp. NPDC102441 TaxID=3366176 RepID=UPI0038221301
MTATSQLLGDLLAELHEVTDSGDALDSAIVAAVEGAQMIAVAAEAAREGAGAGTPLELAREALGAMRASVVAATVSVRTLEDRRRTQGVGSP